MFHLAEARRACPGTSAVASGARSLRSLCPGYPPAPTVSPEPTAAVPRRFHGTVTLESTLIGCDARRVAEEVIAHLTGLVGARVTVTFEVEAQIPDGASEHVVRIVTENSRTRKFTSQGFETE